MSDIDAVHALREGFVAAFNEADIEAMAGCLTEDSVGMPPGKAVLAGLDANRADWQAGLGAGKSVFEADSIEVEVDGDIAYDRFEWTVTFTPEGSDEASVDGGNCVWIDKRQSDGSWKIHRSIWNSTREDSSPWT